ncbi:hypothetical protein QZH41_017980, partial [Actinostola sp. cb2023]
SKAPELANLCGSKTPKAPIRTSGNTMYVVLTSDDADTGKGFLATWKAVSRNINCEWIISVPITHSLTLNFETFSIEQSAKCSYDSVEIWEGAKKNSASLGRFCGTNSPGQINAQETTLRIKLHSDESDTGRGFKAVWTSKNLAAAQSGVRLCGTSAVGTRIVGRSGC